MNIIKSQMICKFGIILSLVNLVFPALAADNVIQQEKMSYEKCLEVIMTSETKLSISPEISDVAGQKRIAVFTLSDGTLTIACDGEINLVTVSTHTE